MRIDEHPLWHSHILPLLFINGRRPRVRIEVREPATQAARRLLLQVEIRCVRCGRWIHPIRERLVTEPAWGSRMYLTVGCPPEVKKGCSRGRDGTVEAQRIVGLLQGRQDDPAQRWLFDV